MPYANIFPLSLQGPSLLYPLLASIVCTMASAALFQFGYNRIIQKLYAESNQWKMLWRAQLYVLLVNAPALILILTGILYNNSLLPMQVSLKMDEIYILIVSAYICYLQQSRHTPVRGFVFLKDCLLILLSLGLLSDLYLNGSVSLVQALSLIPVYMFTLVMQAFTNELESCILTALGIRQKNNYKASFLLTQKSNPSNFLQIKDIILTQQTAVQQQLKDFVRIASELKKDNDELSILINFSKLFIPIKKAYEIHQTLENQSLLQEYENDWEKRKKEEERDKDHNQSEDQTDKMHSLNHSSSTLFMKRTITTDQVIEDEEFADKQVPEGVQVVILKVLKYSFYPLYLSTEITGRFRFFLDYLIFFMIGGCMFVLSNAIAYFSFFVSSNQNVVSLIYSLLLCYPLGHYFMKVSSGANDYDFLGIFMQGVIFKIVVFSLGLAILSFVSSNAIMERGTSTFTSLAMRCGTYVVFGCFMAWKRFAIRYSSLKVFAILLIISQGVRIIQENIMEYNLG